MKYTESPKMLKHRGKAVSMPDINQNLFYFKNRIVKRNGTVSGIDKFSCSSLFQYFVENHIKVSHDELHTCDTYLIIRETPGNER